MIPVDMNLYPVIPEILLTVLALSILMLDLFVAKTNKSLLGWISVIGLIIILIVSPFTMDATPVFSSMMVSDGYSTFFDFIVLTTTIITIVISMKYLDLMRMHTGEYYALLLFAALGMMIMAGSLDLVTLYVGLELMAITVYILVASRRHNQLSIEAALKYFILGALSSAILLYGISFIYGFTGSTNYTVIATFMKGAESQPIPILGILLIAVGFCFKVAMFPFHAWSPDAYEGAPAPVTAFMSVAVKVAAFAVFLKVFILAFGDMQPTWSRLLWILSILTMIFGSVLAIPQKNIIRMLAFSSIAHTGIIAIGLMVFNVSSLASTLYYLLVYAFMNLGAFTIVVFCIGKNRKGEFINDYQGMAGSNPWIAFLFTLFLLSLAGIPPTGGFLAKFYIFAEAINSGYYVLATVGVLTTAISLFFYAKIIFYMYMKDPEEKHAVAVGIPGGVVIGLMAIATIMFGLFPTPFMNFALTSIKAIF